MSEGVPTLLIVEDNTTQQYILKRLCEEFDFAAHAVSSGEEALDALAVTRYAAIMMDLILPGIGGIECARVIRQLEVDRSDSKHVPIIAITAVVGETVRQQCLAAGMDDFLRKPFDPEDLRKILLRHLYEAKRPNLKILKGYRLDKTAE